MSGGGETPFRSNPEKTGAKFRSFGFFTLFFPPHPLSQMALSTLREPTTTYDRYPTPYKSTYKASPAEEEFLLDLQGQHVSRVFEEMARQGRRNGVLDGRLFSTPMCYRNVDPSRPCVCGARFQCPLVLPSAINGYCHVSPQRPSITRCPACEGDLLPFEYDEDDYPEEWAEVKADLFCVDCSDLFCCRKKN